MLNIIWSGLPEVEVKITKGYMVPEIQTRSSTIDENRDCRAFVTRFGSLVYKLILSDLDRSWVFRTDICFSIICKDFPNVEELRCIGDHTTEFILRDANFPLLRVRRFYFEPCGSIYEIIDPASRLLRLMPDVEEIYRVPMTMVKEFQDLGKLDVVRSVTYYRQGICNSGLYFEPGEDLSKRFPNVNTISFHHFKERTWTLSEQWWLPGGMFHSENFRRKITCLKFSEDSDPDSDVERALLEKFVSVREIITEVDDIKREYIADGVIFPM
ncbi:unnamed protein product [Allacma fusca]|uniref:Uncharacterized protein n=1 Tax=Allacma fusca TaxID=39272 RepID=A0A8J2KHZ1_9HEXA|nr:unnamed protein product [Allacma fusca]